jgi:Icc-related predicted phosphoesterase
MLSVKDMMMDYRAITIENSGVYHKLRPIDTFKANQEAIGFIKEGVRGWDGKVVVIGHHAPSFNSVHPKYTSQTIMNHAFVNELDEYIIDHPQIALWVHGHVHDCWDYTIGNTRIVCNPRGYPGEINGFNPNFIVEI